VIAITQSTKEAIMAKKVAIAATERGRGRPTRFATPITSQVPVGLDAVRHEQLRLLREHLQATSAGDVTMSDVMRTAFDWYVRVKAKEVPALQDTIT
jgi:hypothetical protein